MPNERTKAEQLALALVHEVRAFCRSQASLWQTVPYLALEAQGKGGFSDNLYNCLHTGFWMVTHHGSGGSFVACSIDCATGELANQYASIRQERLVLARAEEILPLCSHLDDLDAELVVVKLTEKSAGVLSGARDSREVWTRERTEFQHRWALHPDRPFIRPPWPGEAVTA